MIKSRLILCSVCMILCLSLTHCSGISTDSGTESITGLHRANSLLYVYGKTESNEFPTTKSVVKPGETLDYSQGFYSVFTTSGQLVSSSEIGGFGTEVIVDLTTDKDNNIYIIGTTGSSNLLDQNEFTKKRICDAFVAKVSSEFDIIWTRRFGGKWSDYGTRLLVTDDCVYAAGRTESPNFPITEGDTKGSCFIMKLDFDGTMKYCKRFGGVKEGSRLGGSSIKGMDLDRKGNIVISGTTTSLDFPVTYNAVQPHHSFLDKYSEKDYMDMKNPFWDGFITIFSPDMEMLYSTYLGGGSNLINLSKEKEEILTYTEAGHEYLFGCEMDRQGNYYFVGTTNSITFPFTNNNPLLKYQREVESVEQLFAISLNNNFELRWCKPLGEVMHRITPTDFEITPSDEIVVCSEREEQENGSTEHETVTPIAYLEWYNLAGERTDEMMIEDLGNVKISSSNDSSFIIAGETYSNKLVSNSESYQPTLSNNGKKRFPPEIDLYVCCYKGKNRVVNWSTYLGGKGNLNIPFLSPF